MDDTTVNKLRILALVILVVMVLFALSSWQSKEDKDAATHLKLGQMDYENGRYAEAITAYQKAITLKPDYAEVYLSMGNAYYELEQYEATLSAYDKYIALEPSENIGDIALKAISDKSNKARQRIIHEAFVRMSDAHKEESDILVNKLRLLHTLANRTHKSIADQMEMLELVKALTAAFPKLKTEIEAIANPADYDGSGGR